jgi:hypothetical protein
MIPAGSTVAATKQILMSDMLTSENVVGVRRHKTLNATLVQDGISKGLSYSFNVSGSVPAGQSFAVNLVVFALAGMNLQYSDILPVKLYAGHSTGTAGAIITARNVNCFSIDQTPTIGQVITNATPPGDILSMFRDGDINALLCPADNYTMVVENKTAESISLDFSFIVGELGPRIPAVGLTASTELIPTSEMGDFG